MLLKHFTFVSFIHSFIHIGNEMKSGREKTDDIGIKLICNKVITILVQLEYLSFSETSVIRICIHREKKNHSQNRFYAYVVKKLYSRVFSSSCFHIH